MDTIDAMALLYLAKNWNEQETLQSFTQKFLQTKDEISKAMNPDTLNAALDRGDDIM